MLSALVLRPVSAVPLAATLSTLVPGAVDGLLRDVTVVGATDPAVLKVCDHAGCRILSESGIGTALPTFKGQWTLLIRSGYRLGYDWIDVVGRYVASEPSGAVVRVRVLRDGPTSLWQRWFQREPAALLVKTSAFGTALEQGGSLDATCKRLARGSKRLKG